MAEVKVLGITGDSGGRSYLVDLYVSVGGVVFMAPGISPTFKECARNWDYIWFNAVDKIPDDKLGKADPLMEQWVLKRGWMLVSPFTKIFEQENKKCIRVPLNEGGDLE